MKKHQIIYADPLALQTQVAKRLYEKHHPRLFHTFEELQSKYSGSADAILQEANELIEFIKLEVNNG